MMAKKEAEHRQRQDQQGLGRHIVSAEMNGYRIVAVGNRIYWSRNWKTFHDFLRDYPVYLFGSKWVEREKAKPPERQHPYIQWVRSAFEDHKRLATKTGPIFTGPMTAAISSMMALAYNLYLIHHNLPATPKTKQFCEKLIKRLKYPEHFWGALYETYAFSLFAIAGFTIEPEDESNRSSTHCEFTARAKSGRSYSIECKARNRPVLLTKEDGSPQIDENTLGLGKKLKAALSKNAEHERVVFIDLDLPTISRQEQLIEVSDFALGKFRELEGTMQIDGQPAPPAYVLLTNVPDHRNAGDVSLGFQMIGFSFKLADFGQGVIHHGAHAMMRARERHADVLSLKEAAKVRWSIPSTFDGSNPALAFSEDNIPRLKIGSHYRVPTPDGEMEGELIGGSVMPEKKKAWCVFRLQNGQQFIGTNTLTDDEVRAYKLHPETFFGVVKNTTRKAETFEDMFDFFFEMYQHTPIEKLLEFMANAPNRDELAKQSQRDLAITYCERMAFHAISTLPNKTV